MAELGRVLTAMVTPFDHNLQVDYDQAAELAVKLLAEGNDGLVVAGTTGESPTLSDEEKLQLFRVVKQAAGDKPIVAGTGSNDFAHSVHLTSAAEATGVDAVMLVGPYYNKPSQEGFYQYFSQAARATSLPLIIYNVPGRTGSNFSAETTLRLAADVPNLAGIKEASGDLGQITKICAEAPEGFMVWSGDDNLTLPILAVGGGGVISVVAQVAGQEMAAMVRAYLAGEPAEAARLHQRLSPLFKAAFLPGSGSPACIKRALQLTGFDCGGLRLPLVEASAEDTAALRKVLEGLGLV